MKNPKPKRIREMCDMMEVAHEMYDTDINMLHTTIDRTACGTVCCHAGLFVLARLAKKDQNDLWPFCWKNSPTEGLVMSSDRLSYTGRQYSEVYDNPWVQYTDGAMLMALFLGFDSEAQLSEWADKNPFFWGNIYGGGMFSMHTAFGATRVTTSDIILHWRGVARRIEFALD